ncbi:MAG: helix-turn-helix domain-containing protein [Jejuia sp.]
MREIQIIGLTPEENRKPVFEYIDKKFEDLKKHLQPKEPTTYLTRNEVAEMLSVDLSTVHNLSVKGILQKYQIGGRVLYKRKEIEEAITKLEK